MHRTRPQLPSSVSPHHSPVRSGALMSTPAKTTLPYPVRTNRLRCGISTRRPRRCFARLPLSPEQFKRAHAVAISPNGELVAYSVPPLSAEGGSFRPGTSVVYVLRRGTGEMVQMLNRSSDDIVARPQAMRFSPDGELLAAVLSSGCGLRVWSTRRWELIARDDRGYGGDPPPTCISCHMQSPLHQALGEVLGR